MAEAVVTAEKNCNVRIDGSEFNVGDRILLFKDVDGKKKKLAIVEVAKKSSKTRVLGRVVKGPAVCTPLKGTNAELLESKDGAVAVKGFPGLKFEFGSLFNISMISQSSLSLVQDSTTKSAPRIQAIGVLASGDVYPLTFWRDGFLYRSLGLGLSVGSAMVFPQSEIADSAGAIVGKLSTTAFDLRADTIFRAVYASDKMATELRLVPYFQRQIKHTFTGDTSTGATAPLVNVTFSGMGVGVTQRVRIGDRFRFGAAGFLPLNMTGKAANSGASEQTGLANVSGYQAEIFGDYFFSKLKIFASFRYESFSGVAVVQDSITLQDSKATIGDERISYGVGIGFLL
jgi:hypothetical protein